jgi:vacuolar-type H+-ATPase subunit H
LDRISDLILRAKRMVMSEIVDSEHEYDWLLRSARMKDRSRIKDAMDKQDEIRESSGEGNLSSEIRKWRDRR